MLASVFPVDTPREREGSVMLPRSRTARIAASVRLALGAFALLASDAAAQTWLNPNSGTWSDGANWAAAIAPISDSSTQLTFNASAGETYSTSNDIADPFTLNS